MNKLSQYDVNSLIRIVSELRQAQVDAEALRTHAADTGEGPSYERKSGHLCGVMTYLAYDIQSILDNVIGTDK